MSAPKKVSDEAILGAIRELERTERVGATHRELAAMLGLSLPAIRDRLTTLVDAGVIELSAVRGFIIHEQETKSGDPSRRPRSPGARGAGRD